MDVLSFIRVVLSNVWAILGLGLLVLLLGWVAGLLLANWLEAAFRRVRLFRLLAQRIGLQDTERLAMRLGQAIRIVAFLIGCSISWRVLNTSPDIHQVVSRGSATVGDVLRLPSIKSAGNLLLVILATYLLFRMFGWLRKAFLGWRVAVEAQRGRLFRDLRFQRVQLLSAGQLTSLLRNLIRYALYVVDVLLTLVYLTVVFSVVPQTRGVVAAVLHSILQVINQGWLGFVRYLPSLLNLVLIIIITHYGLRILRFVFNEIGKGTITLAGFHPEWAIPTFQLVRFGVIALAVIFAFPFLPGSASPAFQGVSIFIGALFSLGSTSVVANIVAGIVLTYTRAFRAGDRVKIADTVGDVVEKTLLVTRLRTIKNVEVTIPNSLVLQSHIINYSAVSQERGLILNTTITLGYDVPWRRVHETLISAARKTDGILADPRPFVLQTSLDESYVSYELNAYTDQPNAMANIYSDLHQNVQDACNEAGIEILSPHYSALRDGNTTTIPAEHRPGGYQAPSFGVKLDGGPKPG
jgi:small-conductance mechanosensitive channel